MKKIGALLGSILITCLVLSGCGGGSSKSNTQSTGSTKTLSSITVSSQTKSVAAGATLQLAAKGNYSDGTTADLTSQVTWSTSDSTVATTSAAGLLSSVHPGTVVATAKLNSTSGSMTITVSSATLSSISVSGGATLVAGLSEQLSAQGTYSDSSTQTVTSLVSWQSSDATVATVSASGMLTSLKAGTVTITASMNSVSGTSNVTVSSAGLSSITITPAGFSIASGQSKQLSALGVYSDGTSHDVTSLATWTAIGASATVNSSGLVTGVSAGNSTITATIGSATASATATVSAAQLTSIVVAPATASIAAGQTQSFTASGIFSDGSTTDITNSVTWNSSATNFATISAAGLATGVSAGSASITASSGSVTSSPATLTITSAVLTEIDIAPDGQYIPVGGQYPLSLTATYSDNSTQTITSASWSSSDTTLASVDPTSGIVTGVANSNNNPVTITAGYGGMTNTTTVYITDAVPESLQLTPASASVATGTTQQYTVDVVYSDGSIQPVTAGLSWLSSSAAVAGIDANGLATAIAPGQTTITVGYDSMTATASLTVTPATLTDIVVTPATTVVGINGNVQFTATGVFTDNSTQDLTSLVVWSSSNASYALISAGGLATGASAGTTTISASYGSVSGSATLNVTTATLVSINITPSNPIVPPHSKVQLTAIGTFSDGSQLVLSGVSWHTSGARYAMVNGSGVLRTKKSTNKAVTVSATLNGITGTTAITITSMTIQSLTVNPIAPTIAVGTTQQFALLGLFSDGVTTVDLTASARWQTSNYQDAVINRQGIATGVKTGTVTISGSINGQTPATATLTVSNATIQSITVTPALPTIALGSVQQFAAIGLFSDGSTEDITSVATWTSSTPTVAVVNQNGVASSAIHGQTNIAAQFKGVTGSTLLSVN
jgi:uncharacterized protein YjdB